MRLSRKAPGLIVTAVGLVLFLYLSLAWWQIARNARLNANENLHWMVALLRAGLEDTSTRALAQAEMIAMAPTVGRAFQSGDREVLQMGISRIFDLQRKRYGLDQLNFYTPASVAFLRVQAPAQHSDQVDPSHTLVGMATRLREPMKGVEIGRSGPAVYGLAPIMDGRSLLGVCAVGMQFSRLIEQLHQDYNIDAAAVFDEHKLREVVADYRAAATQDTVDGFTRQASSDWELCQQVLEGANLQGLHDPLTMLAQVHDTEFGAAVLPLRDVDGALLGHLVAVRDFGQFGTRARRARVLATGASLFALVTLAGVVLVVVNGMLLRPVQDLTERMQALQRGEDPPVADPPLLARRDEVGELARVYRDMRP